MTKPSKEMTIGLFSVFPEVAISNDLPTEERLEELARMRMPDQYYYDMIEKYNSDELREALEEGRSKAELDEIVRRLANESSDGESASESN